LRKAMSSEITATGGASVGSFNATWPFARLRASASRLSLSCGIFGSWEFSPEEVVRLEGEPFLFGLGGRMRIVHAKPQYPDKVVFGCLGGADALIRRIGQVGFRSRPGTAQLAAAARIEERGANPVRWSFIILLDAYGPGNESHKPGVLTMLVFASLFLASFALPRFPGFQSLVMKPGRSVSEILPVIRLTQLISGAGVVAFAIHYLSG
jgi:hypothetical protein